MVSHASLVAEIEVINSMSTEDRLAHARQRRQEQVQRWHDAEETFEQKNAQKIENGLCKRTVKFGASVTLLEAAARDDLAEVKSLLEDQTDPNEANDDGLTALHQACIDNFEDMVKLLIKHKANVNAVDSELWTPLHAACTCGHTNIAKILIQSGADLLALNADNNMPYDICEDDETLDYVEKIMAAKGITQDQINNTRSSKERQIISDMQALIDQGKSLSDKDEVGGTVLHIAAAYGYVELAKFLLHHRFQVNVQDKDGWTALHAAACWYQLDVVELLGQQGADPTIKNSLGEQPSDVTDDDEIKITLIKIRSEMKVKKTRKLFSGFRAFSSRNNSRRASGIRGQSFKGRSKRDKKSGISTIEAKSEAQFWSGNQQSADILNPKQAGRNESFASHSFEKQSNNFDVKKETNLQKTYTAKEFSSLRKANSDPASLSKSDKLQKKDKKRKKGKKAPENKQSSTLVEENFPQQTEPNGARSFSVIGARDNYSLAGLNGDAPFADDVGNSFPGKTLAELKRERAQEKSKKAPSLTPPGDHSSAQTGGDCLDSSVNQFKGLTANELSGKSHKRYCVIL